MELNHRAQKLFPGHIEMNLRNNSLIISVYIFQYQLNWSEGNLDKLEGMGRNVQAKTKLLFLPSKEIGILWTQIWLQMQSACQHDYTMQSVYAILNREAVGIDHFTQTECTDKKWVVSWTSLEKSLYILLRSPWPVSWTTTRGLPKVAVPMFKFLFPGN